MNKSQEDYGASIFQKCREEIIKMGVQDKYLTGDPLHGSNFFKVCYEKKIIIPPRNSLHQEIKDRKRLRMHLKALKKHSMSNTQVLNRPQTTDHRKIDHIIELAARRVQEGEA